VSDDKDTSGVGRLAAYKEWQAACMRFAAALSDERRVVEALRRRGGLRTEIGPWVFRVEAADEQRLRTSHEEGRGTKFLCLGSDRRYGS
jgi:hypothetical protein